MSTRAERRQSIADAIGGAFSGCPVYADPLKSLLLNTNATGLQFALVRGVRKFEASVEMQETHQDMFEFWEVYFKVPAATAPATEDQADAVFELLQDTLAPEAGFKPGGDAAELEVQDESVFTRDAQTGTIYIAVYANEFWRG